jgi:antibiotic biosynthesis monooxygenase (ABM) superfamily enzyme
MDGVNLPCGITTKIALASDLGTTWASWQSAFTRAAADAPGFISLEIISVSGVASQCHVIQRFGSTAMLELWRGSETRKRLR